MKNTFLALSLACNLIAIPWLAWRVLQLDSVCRTEMVWAVELAYEVGYWQAKGSAGPNPQQHTRLQVSKLSNEELTAMIHPATAQKLDAYFSEGRCRAKLSK